MPRYAITERAGPFVAAHHNTGVGTVLDLTERQAEHELRLGTLVRLPGPHETAAAGPRVDPPLDVAARPEPASAPVSEQETDAAAPSRKPKRSAT
ncbi:hypothetical protein [Aestuariivirga sp.]|uniref:hypothetical protein n=1 Tax=Aestuariivirga sp. TaxID=2650926 RepID=UPI00391B2130